MTKRPSISVFFPFLNDWGTVGSLVGLAIATVERLTDDWEVLIINDGSRKEDREALGMVIDVLNSNLKSQISNPKLKVRNQKKIRIVDHEKNRGYGGALISGFKAAAKELIFYTDGDAQYDPRELINLYRAISPGVDMVNGYKIKRNDPLHRVIAGKLYHYFVKLAFGIPVRDTDCDFRLIRKRVFARVRLFETTGTICLELVKKIDYLGYKIAEVPVHHYWRTSGKSQFFNFKRLFKTGTNLMTLWWKLIVRKEYES